MQLRDHLFRLLFAASLGLGAACFESGSEVECPQGSSGCSCRDDGSCNASLVCNADGNCIDPDCVDGTQACPCYGNGSCDPGLTCTNNICQPGAGSTGAVTTVAASETGDPGGTADSGTDSTGPGQTSDVADSSTDDGADTGSGPTGPGDSGSSTPCGSDCGPGQACDVDAMACVATDYGPCSAGVDLCAPPAVCDDLGAGYFVCAQPCMEAAPDCSAEGSATPICVEVSGCQLMCSGDVDCPPYFGMTCHEGRCAFAAG